MDFLLIWKWDFGMDYMDLIYMKCITFMAARNNLNTSNLILQILIFFAYLFILKGLLQLFFAIVQATEQVYSNVLKTGKNGKINS